MDFEIEDYLNFTGDDEENGCAMPSQELHQKPLLRANTAPVHATYTFNSTKQVFKTCLFFKDLVKLLLLKKKNFYLSIFLFS